MGNLGSSKWLYGSVVKCFSVCNRAFSLIWCPPGRKMSLECRYGVAQGALQIIRIPLIQGYSRGHSNLTTFYRHLGVIMCLVSSYGVLKKAVFC